ncbi:MAG TPA: MFS transporter [Fibrobacteria bacterium]|jgi:predicted MFS family arabinose efflux permease|nr:MFS transporter [Fibrobacteria bacterium]
MNAPQAPQAGNEGFFADLKKERAFLLLLACMQFTHMVDFMILMPLGPRLLDVFGMTPGRFGSIVSAYTFSAGIASVLAALFLDRIDRKKSLLTVYFGFTISTLLCGLAPNEHLLLLARILTGAFGGVMVATVMALISDVIPLSRRGAAMGLVMTAFSVASVAGVPLGILLSNHFGWQMPFFAIAAISLIMWIAAFRLLPSLRRPSSGVHMSNPIADFVKVLSVPAHWRAFAFTFAMMGPFLMIPFISSYYFANGGVTNEQMPWVFFAGGLATFFTTRHFGRLGDKLGLGRVYGWTALAACAPILLITHLGPWGIWVAMPATALGMVLISGRIAPGMALVTSVVEPRLRGSFMSINTALQQVASGVGSLVGGALIVQGAHGGKFSGYGTVGWIACGVMLVSIWLGSGLGTKNAG